MKLRITHADTIDGKPSPPCDFYDVLTVEVDPDDADQRTQAERNADNALAAARLARVEAELQRRLDHLELIAAEGGKRLSVEAVRGELKACLEAPVGP